VSQTVPPGANEVLLEVGAELDVRELPKAQRHASVFNRFDTLTVGESFVLVTSDDPEGLHEEFDRTHPCAYVWTYLVADEPLWRIQISRRAAANVSRVLADLTAQRPGSDLPRVLADSTALRAATDLDPDSAGAVWRLDMAQRQLDANVIRLRPETQIEGHLGPELDVLLHVLGGSGQIITVAGPVPVEVGALVWLPRRSQRAILAGPEGLTYLSVHGRRTTLSITTPTLPTDGR
jgi:uncharacterized protein (DUF2249 family)